jgi:hypothetical protein
VLEAHHAHFQLVFQRRYRLLDRRQANLFGQELAALGKQLGAPLGRVVVLALLPALRRRDIPLVGGAGDGLFVGHDQVQIRVGQCGFRRVGQHPVDGGL